MKNWEFWVAILLFFVGGGCLVTAVQVSPFGPVSESLVPLLQGLRLFLLLLLAVIMIQVLLRAFRVPRGGKCHCGKRLERGWLYCPHCGKELPVENP